MKESEKAARARLAALPTKTDTGGETYVLNKRGGRSLSKHVGYSPKTTKDGIIRRALKIPPKGH